MEKRQKVGQGESGIGEGEERSNRGEKYWGERKKEGRKEGRRCRRKG
jgi:hypothetical protein